MVKLAGRTGFVAAIERVWRTHCLSSGSGRRVGESAAPGLASSSAGQSLLIHVIGVLRVEQRCRRKDR